MVIDQAPMADGRSPRAVAVKLSAALMHLDLVQPHALRGPVADILRAGIELCALSDSLLGKPIMHAVAVAEAITDAAGRGQRVEP